MYRLGYGTGGDRVKDTELMTQCIIDARECLRGQYCLTGISVESTMGAVVRLACELFNYRTFTGQTTIAMEGEDDKEDGIPF